MWGRSNTNEAPSHCKQWSRSEACLLLRCSPASAKEQGQSNDVWKLHVHTAVIDHTWQPERSTKTQGRLQPGACPYF